MPRVIIATMSGGGAPRAGHARCIAAGPKAMNPVNMRSVYLMKESDLKWNQKREKYRKMLAEYRAKGGVVTRLPTTFEAKGHCPTFSFIIGPEVLRRPGYSPRIEECRNAPKPVKNG